MIVTLTLTSTLALVLGLGLTPGKTIRVENLKSNAKDEYRRRRLGKIFKTCVDETFYVLEVTPS